MIDFFDINCQQLTNEESFGIIDSEEKTPAEISTTNPENWIAIVSNEQQKLVTFTAIDNCIEILRPNGKMESKCDCMLQYDNNIDFIELKEKQKKWIADGIEQLEITILIFTQNYDLSLFKRKRAYLTNRLRPRFQHSHKEIMQKFKSKTQFRLVIYNMIKI